MTIDRIRPMVLRVTLHAYELSALVTAGRWLVSAPQGEIPKEAIEQLRHVLESYDAEVRRLGSGEPPAESA